MKTNELVSIAAHQLRNPLVAFKWGLRLLLDGELGELNSRQIELLKKEYARNEHTLKLINNILDVARIEEGKFGYEFKELELVSFVNSLVESFETLAKSRRVDLNFEADGKKLPFFADKEKFSLALSNFIENSLNYTPEGGKISVHVGIDKNFAKLKISDTGIGIPAQEQKKIFSKFFRASNAVRRETEGTGLGLFIAKNIVEKHGGRLTFASKEGQGTTFTITLPLNRRLIPDKEAV